MFELHKNYREIFPEPEFAVEKWDFKSSEICKIKKIKYEINLLPYLGTHIQDGEQEDFTLVLKSAFMEQLCESDDMVMFTTRCMK